MTLLVARSITEMLLDLAFPTYKNPFPPLSVLFSICAEAKSTVNGKTKYEASVTKVIGIRINRNKIELLFSFFNIVQ